jgi:hypothetical protein
MEDKLFGKIMVEVNGQMVDIADLPRADYERFLELMHKKRIAYIALQSDSKYHCER